MAWNGRLGDARALGYEVAVVTYDTVAKIAAFAESRKVGYAILSDAKSEIIRAFGVLDDSHKPGSFAYGIPRPIIFVLDAKGIVRHRFSEESYRQRPEIDVVLDSIRKSSGRGAEG
jgi:peroxiredoxin